VRQYAALLGIDGDRIIREHSELFNRPANAEFSYGIGTLEMRGNPGASVKWFPNILWVGAIVLIVVLSWYFARFLEVI
jgi:cytoskeletal protein RodZ